MAVGLDPDVCGERHETVPDPVGGWTVSFFEDCQVQTAFEGVATETDADGDQTWTTAPMVDLHVDPAADQVWAAWWRAATLTTITNAAALAAKSTKVGESYAVAVKVTVARPGSGTPTGPVAVSDGSATCTVAALTAAGTGSCTLISTSAGLKTIAARYDGTADFGPSVATVKHRVR